MHIHTTIVHSDHDAKTLDSQLNSLIEKNSFSDKFARNVKLVFEEIILQNLVPYSEAYYNIYPISVDADYLPEDGSFLINFSYSGMQFDPIEGYLDLSAAIVRKIADNVDYRYENGVNYLKVLLKQK